jgi:hypothetical protein
LLASLALGRRWLILAALVATLLLLVVFRNGTGRLYDFLTQAPPLELFKLISLTVAGALGVLGAATETRNPDSHEMTGWGITVIVGIALSTLLAAYAQAAESEEAVRSTAEAAARYTEQIRVLRRVADPVPNKLEASFAVSYNTETPVFGKYVARLKREQVHMAGDIQPFTGKSALFARTTAEERDIRDLLLSTSVHIGFFKKGRSLIGKPDLDLVISTDDNNSRVKLDAWPQYSFEDAKLKVLGGTTAEVFSGNNEQLGTWSDLRQARAIAYVDPGFLFFSNFDVVPANSIDYVRLAIDSTHVIELTFAPRPASRGLVESFVSVPPVDAHRPG